MRFLFVLGLSVCAAVAAVPALAADASGVDCKTAVTQTDTNICADMAFKKQDNLLNGVYRAYRAKLTDERRTDLTKAQKVRLTFRDAECDFEAADYQGGSMQPWIYATCLSELTRQRREALQALLKDAEH